MNKDAPIGFFDSGLGGLCVLARAMQKMPRENFIYFGDNAFAPYGSKSREEIFRRSSFIVDFLLQKGVKAIVIACNTATGVAVKELREMHRLPIISMEPAVKVAKGYQTDGKIAVLATPATLQQEKYRQLIQRLGCEQQVLPLPCAGLVELIEAGKLDGAQMETYLERILKPLAAHRIDSVVLGCTHYVFVKRQIERALTKMGKVPVIVDGAQGTVNHLKEILLQSGQYNDRTPGSVRVYTSGDPEQIRPMVRAAIGDQKIEVVG